jgi:hypothetical protein
MFSENAMDLAGDAEVFDALRRLGLGLLASDAGAGARLAYPLLCQAQALQASRARGPLRQAPEASARALFERALAEEATGRKREALEHYMAVVDGAPEAMDETPAQQEWAAIRSAAEEARERIRLDKPHAQAVRHAAAAAMDRAIRNCRPDAPPGSETGAATSLQHPERSVWGAEAGSRLLSGRERWNQYRIWYRHGGRVFSLGFSRDAE